MNRVDFMNQLESLLQSISSTEREEAIQYYNDYFDDAGEENEQEVIEALGNPARVAENIKRDLAGNGYGEGFAQKVKASDRVLMEYGKNIPEDSEEPQDSEESPVAGQTGAGTAGNSGQKSADAASEGILDRIMHGRRKDRPEIRLPNTAGRSRILLPSTAGRDRILLLDTIGRNRTSLRHTAGKPGMPQADTCSLLELTAAVRAIPLKITETEADMPPEPAAGVRGNKILSALSRKSEKREKACRCGQLQC